MTEAAEKTYVDVVRMDGIRMAYGNVVALRDVTMHIGRNEIVGLIGDNGAGKSTLVRCICGIHAPDAGQVTLKDTPANATWKVTATSLASAVWLTMLENSPKLKLVSAALTL